jgi:NTP pyrophosphatase (non-canonical NTP hydrolase)
VVPALGEEGQMSTWKAEIERIHEQALKKSGIRAWSFEDTCFTALALAGEVGELANIVKKQWRGDERPALSVDPAVRAELADIRIYLHLLSASLKIDIDEAIEEKLPAIRNKFLQVPR